jgi:hypothetical protein
LPLAPAPLAPGGLRFFTGVSRRRRCCADHCGLLSASLSATAGLMRQRCTLLATCTRHAPRRWVFVEQRQHALCARRVDRLCALRVSRR